MKGAMTASTIPTQLELDFIHATASPSGREQVTLAGLLAGDLDFHGDDVSYASHNFHSFPAKFPPQLPRLFIEHLTRPGDIVLDPMMGSGTTILEAVLAGRKAFGFDIDPHALLLTQVKTTPLDPAKALSVGLKILTQAAESIVAHYGDLEKRLDARFEERTREFLDYWFARETQVELLALVEQIEQVDDEDLQAFLRLTFSAVIITKSGGVSLALDLAHTRPHRAKVVRNRAQEIILGADLADDPSPRTQLLTKTLRSPLEDFERKLRKNVEGLQGVAVRAARPRLDFSDAQDLPLASGAVDLIVTSPPYASNAIDYMRAHKFSLVWFGHDIASLSQKRKEYIGGEEVSRFEFEDMPEAVQSIIEEIESLDEKRALVLHRYYSEMRRALREMYRVLRPGKAAVVVVGSSVMRGRDTETQRCLAAIGETVGFEVPGIGVRHLDRDRRMMPAAAKRNGTSQIQQRMHEEYVIGFLKPE